jgi:hypothetical protein
VDSIICFGAALLLLNWLTGMSAMLLAGQPLLALQTADLLLQAALQPTGCAEHVDMLRCECSEMPAQVFAPPTTGARREKQQRRRVGLLHNCAATNHLCKTSARPPHHITAPLQAVEFTADSAAACWCCSTAGKPGQQLTLVQGN